MLHRMQSSLFTVKGLMEAVLCTTAMLDSAVEDLYSTHSITSSHLAKQISLGDI